MNFDGLIEVLKIDDGSLPDIWLKDLSDVEVIHGYKYLRDNSERISSKDSSYWSPVLEKEVSFSLTDNPAEKVVSGEADSFHLCFDGVFNTKGFSIPELGLYVAPDTLALNYRMGPEWTCEAIAGLFELIQGMALENQTLTLEHTGNINDIDGSILLSYWSEFKNA